MLNKAILIGRLTADPELRQTPNGITVTSFSIAVDRRFSRSGGERQTDFLDIVAWRQQAEFVCKYFQKGRLIGVEGSIQVRSYTDRDGNKRRAWEIQADNVFFVDSKNSSSQQDTAPAFYGEPAPAPSSPSPVSGAAASGSQSVSYSSGSVGYFEEIEADSDLPF